MLFAGVILPSGNVFATTESEAQAACNTLGGTGSKYRQDGMWNYKCTGYTTSWTGTAKDEACKVFGGSIYNPTSDIHVCLNANSSIVITDSSSSSTTTTTGGNNNGGGNSNPSNTNSSSPSSSSSNSSSNSSNAAGPTYDPGTYKKVDTGKNCAGISTSIIGCDDSGNDGDALFSVLALILNIVTYGVGAAAIIGVIITGFQYMTARDNSAQVVKAKNRLLQVVIGLVIWLLFWGIIQFLLPGGLFGNGS